MFWIAVTGLLFAICVYPFVKRASSKLNSLYEITGHGAVAVSSPMLNPKDVDVDDFSEYQKGVIRSVYFIPKVFWNSSTNTAISTGMHFLGLLWQQESESCIHIGFDESVKVRPIGPFCKGSEERSSFYVGGSFPNVLQWNPNNKRLVLLQSKALDRAESYPSAFIYLHGVELGLPLIPSYPSIPTARQDSDYLKKRFPPWRIHVNGLLGFFIGWWGWHAIRNNRRLFWGICSFIFGMMLWNYAVYKFLEWSAQS